MKKALPIRICSPHKSDKKRGFVYELYTTHMLVAFFNRMHDIEDIPFAILSRKHGICFSWVEHDNYNDADEKTDDEIRAILAGQFKQFGNEYRFVYWNHRPMTHDKWVRMLKEARFETVECRTLGGVAEETKLRCYNCDKMDPGWLIHSDASETCSLGKEIEEDHDASNCKDYHDNNDG